MAKIKKRKLRKKIVFSLILLAILLIIGGTKLLQQSSTNYKLHQLNYSNEAIKNINKNHLTQKVIDENIYTKTLEAAFVSNDFKKEYLDIYTEIDYRNNENFINNINNLANIGYKKDDINAIFTYLNNNDIDKINNRDIINNISQYISVSMFKTDNIDRYISYKAKNTNLDYETVISYVNIGLDYPFYDHVTVIKDPDNILLTCS